MNQVKEFCNQPCTKLICLELISKHKRKVVTCVKFSNRLVDTFYAVEGIYSQSLIVVNVPQHDLLLSVSQTGQS